MNNVGVVDRVVDTADTDVLTGMELRPLTIVAVEDVAAVLVTIGIDVRPLTTTPVVVFKLADSDAVVELTKEELVVVDIIGIDPSPGVIASVVLMTTVLDVEADTFLCCCAAPGLSRVVYPAIGPVNAAEAVTKTIVMLAGEVRLELVVILVKDVDELLDDETEAIGVADNACV